MNDDKRPNIVFYFSDQQRPDTIGCYGQKLDITPNLDRLAAEGTLFENAFTGQPVCGPCRAIFQTGRYATDTDCFRNNKMLPLNVKTLANYVEGNGYETAYCGKWHLASEGELEKSPTVDYQIKAIPPELRGGYTGWWRAADVLEFTSDAYGGYIFDENMNRLDWKGYRCDFITDQAIEYIDQYDGKKPFFMTVSHIEPHHQNNAHHYQGPVGSKEKYREYEVPADLAACPEGDWAVEWPDYLGQCASVDYNLGRLVDALKKHGLYDNTIIIYTSDHGSHFRTRNRDENLNGYDDYKRTAHDAASHVPLVITGGPFRQGGKRVEELVSTVSIPKTIATLAGCHVDDHMIGERLQDVASGMLQENRKNEVFIQVSESRIGRAVRTAKWKYAVVAPGVNGGLRSSNDVYKDDFMYDVENDPAELKNLVHDPEYDEVKAELRKKLLAWILEAEHTVPEIID